MRGAGNGEDNAEGGGVRRLALNRWPLEECWFVKKNKKKTKTIQSKKPKTETFHKERKDGGVEASDPKGSYHYLLAEVQLGI